MQSHQVTLSVTSSKKKESKRAKIRNEAEEKEKSEEFPGFVFLDFALEDHDAKGFVQVSCLVVERRNVLLGLGSWLRRKARKKAKRHHRPHLS